MCVAGGESAALPSSDSGINYDDGDSGEWQSSSSSSSSSVEDGGRSKELPAPSSPWSLGGLPVPSNLIRWNDPLSADPRPPHGHVRSRMHHVRHEQHYLQGHHRASKPNKLHAVSEVILDENHHQKGRHGHHGHHNNHHNHHRTAGSTESSEEASVTRHDHRHRQQLADFGVTKDVSHGFSFDRGASLGPRKHYQQVANRKRSTSSFHSKPPSMNALEHTFPSKQERGSPATKNATSKSQYTLRSANPESKTYFEDLLNNYKSHSPLYKEHQAQQQQQKLQTVQPQTRSLTKAKQQRGSSGSSSSSSSSSSNQKATSSKSSKGKQSDNEYDYSYEDEDDDEVQNDGAYGEVAQTTTSRPRRSTTTVTTTTTTTTTTEASQESSSSEEDQGSGGEAGDAGNKQYAMYIQTVSRMKNTYHRNGNNKYSSHSRHTATANEPVDPAKQVVVPRPYSSVTDYKQANFGTKEAVERSFRSYQSHHAKVQEHIRRVAYQGACRVPKPKVIPAPRNGTHQFLPQRTILHRCDDDTACCVPPKRCEAKRTETVTLYFYMTTVEKTEGARSGVMEQMKPHVIYMTNHTECHCVSPPNTTTTTTTTTEQPLVSGRACQCPKHFEATLNPEYLCYCACRSNDRNCISFTEGNESFSMDDRKCISNGICTQPICRYGSYDRVRGKCPAKREQIDKFTHSSRRNHLR
uniref:Uncharacterized protein n=2 Tax=Anopheles triannulatus TaxID=58253 RepID=A0A2M4AAV3_9DIPT